MDTQVLELPGRVKLRPEHGCMAEAGLARGFVAGGVIQVEKADISGAAERRPIRE